MVVGSAVSFTFWTVTMLPGKRMDGTTVSSMESPLVHLMLAGSVLNKCPKSSQARLDGAHGSGSYKNITDSRSPEQYSLCSGIASHGSPLSAW